MSTQLERLQDAAEEEREAKLEADWSLMEALEALEDRLDALEHVVYHKKDYEPPFVDPHAGRGDV